MENAIEKDYVDLFSYIRESHLAKYVHFFRPYIYNSLAENKSFYPFHLECQLIEEHKNDICIMSRDIHHAVEIGPGSSAPVVAKTLPMIKALGYSSSLTHYTAIDLNEEYALGACDIVKKHYPAINTTFLIFDFLKNNAFESLKKSFHCDGNRLYFSFGQTIFSNNSDEEINQLLTNIANHLSLEDYFVFGVDLSNDENALASAYDTEISHQLAFNTMHFLKNKFAISEFDPEGFTPIYRWNAEKSRVEIHLKSNFSQQFRINDNFLTIAKNSVFNIYSSRKYTFNKIAMQLRRHGFKIINLRKASNSHGNQYAIITTQKMSANQPCQPQEPEESS